MYTTFTVAFALIGAASAQLPTGYTATSSTATTVDGIGLTCTAETHTGTAVTTCPEVRSICAVSSSFSSSR